MIPNVNDDARYFAIVAQKWILIFNFQYPFYFRICYTIANTLKLS